MRAKKKPKKEEPDYVSALIVVMLVLIFLIFILTTVYLVVHQYDPKWDLSYILLSLEELLGVIGQINAK